MRPFDRRAGAVSCTFAAMVMSVLLAAVTPIQVGAASLPNLSPVSSFGQRVQAMQGKKPARKRGGTGKGQSPQPTDPKGETAEMRERRLLRECKGRPNAGACTGYAN